MSRLVKEDTLKRGKKSPKTRLGRRRRVPKKIDTSVSIFDVPLFGTQVDQVLRKVWLQRKGMLHVATVNSEYIMEARGNSQFKSVLAHCLTVADGWGVVWAARILYNKTIERLSGVELCHAIVKHASEQRESVFLLGGRDGVAERAARSLRTKYPQLKVSWYSGAQAVRSEKNEEASMTIAKINSVSPDYLLVAYGSPWQDIWIEENRPYLRARVAIGVGGVVDEWAGVVAVCPPWLDKLGFKWLWRVVHEPWRWRRILRVLAFGLLVLFERLKRVF